MQNRWHCKKATSQKLPNSDITSSVTGISAPEREQQVKRPVRQAPPEQPKVRSRIVLRGGSYRSCKCLSSCPQYQWHKREQEPRWWRRCPHTLALVLKIHPAADTSKRVLLRWCVNCSKRGADRTTTCPRPKRAGANDRSDTSCRSFSPLLVQ